MKKTVGIILSFLLVFSLYAQEEHDEHDDHEHDQHQRLYSNSSDKKKRQKTETWIASGKLGFIQQADLDTALNGFFITNPAEKKTISLQHLGNLGSPAQSQIYFDRQQKSDFLFFKPYEIYYTPSEEIQYFNTRLPYTNLSYYSGGPTKRKERRINGVFAVNVTPKFNVGMYGDWLNGYGAYASQSTKSYNTGFFGSYIGKHHHVMANISFNGYENYENGGLVDMETVTNPRETGELEAQNMPVYFEDNVWSKLTNWNSFFNYKYHIGIERDVQVTEDSVAKTFIPVTSFIYTFRSESDRKKYYERSLNAGGRIPVDSFYRANGLLDTLYVNNMSTLDSVRFWQMKHTVGISLNEEFNTLARFGLTGYVTADIKNYTYLNDKDLQKPGEEDSLLGFLINPEYKNEKRYKLGIGATLSKHLGKMLTYDFSGEYFFKDEKNGAGTFYLGGNVQSKFKLWKQDVEVSAHANYRQECPDFFEEYYFSNHIKWDTTFSRKNILSVKGLLSLPSFHFYPSFGLSFMVGLENYKNYIYWDKKAMPQQHKENIQVVQFSIKQQIKFLWYLHWDNEVTYQQTSDSEIIPIPELSWYSNFYFRFDKLFNVLTIQIGADMRYSTKYYAPRYLPATGVFYMQDEYQTGDYPYVSVYANCQLKQARFFIEYNHLNKAWGSNNYIVTPGYALNPSYFKFGVSAYFGN